MYNFHEKIVLRAWRKVSADRDRIRWLKFGPISIIKLGVDLLPTLPHGSWGSSGPPSGNHTSATHTPPTSRGGRSFPRFLTRQKIEVTMVVLNQKSSTCSTTTTSMVEDVSQSNSDDRLHTLSHCTYLFSILNSLLEVSLAQTRYFAATQTSSVVLPCFITHKIPLATTSK